MWPRAARRALVGAQFGERRIAAGDQAFARVVGVGELEQVALVEQPQLQRVLAYEAADLPALECGDPTRACRLAQGVDLGLADHAPIADQHHLVQTEVGVELLHLGSSVFASPT
jgi:hypothetical protein